MTDTLQDNRQIPPVEIESNENYFDQKRKRGDYREDWDHITYKHLITATEHYIVFIDNEGDIDWETSREYDKTGPSDRLKHNSIVIKAAKIEATPCDGIRSDAKIHFKRLIGESLACSFSQDYVSAFNVLEEAENYIMSRSQETSRKWYLCSSIIMSLPFLWCGVFVWFFRKTIIEEVGIGFLWILMASSAGALGALLSVMSRTGMLKFDCSSGRLLHYLEGGSRIWVGAISGIIVVLAIRTEIIFAPLSKGDKFSAIVMLAAIAAGAGERLASSIISTISESKPDTSRQENIKISGERNGE